MSKMHENEFDIHEQLVYKLLKDQCPELSHMPLQRISSSGTDNVSYRLGKEYVVRLPRVLGAEKNLCKEWEWLAQIQKFLTIPISKPLFIGNADKMYPSSWGVMKWQEGDPPHFEQENEYAFLAQDLANFLDELHGIKLLNGPVAQRGIPLKERDVPTRTAIHELKDEIDEVLLTNLWESFLTVSSWDKDLVWVHGDMLPGNILVQNNRLKAVIDFSGLGMGDPACDLIIAWSLFNPQSRRVFRKTLAHIDDNTWRRGQGWALSISLIIIPYYKVTNPALTAVAWRMIEQVLSDNLVR